MEETEIWKIYKKSSSNRYGERVYEVSNKGNVKVNGVLQDFSKYKERAYFIIGRFYIHRAVAELFIPNPYNKRYVDHIDTNTHNNNVNNLRWVTQIENNQNELTRKHILSSLTNRKLSDEHKQNISASCKGRNNTIETRKKISLSSIGKRRDHIWMTDDNKSIFPHKSKVDYYLNIGYHLGRLYNKHKKKKLNNI